ncbi:unnamed protein product [Oikopleura dioica]|uniref:Uncharacterized protein n=1 Tax=Oikopleura dioica TaxID=34765 RepID=E4XF96_OIKDI|nr:unnamed protein product [Oikopleura dioica]
MLELHEGELLKVMLVHMGFENEHILSTPNIFSEREINHSMQFYGILGFLIEKLHLKNAKRLKQTLSADIRFYSNLRERRDFRKTVLAYLKTINEEKLTFKISLYDRPYGESVFNYFFTFINYLRKPLKVVDSVSSTLKIFVASKNDELKSLITLQSEFAYPLSDEMVKKHIKTRSKAILDFDKQTNSTEVKPITQAEKNRIAECYKSLGTSLIECDVPKITTVFLENDVDCYTIHIIDGIVSLSSFLENPRTVENSIDSLNEKMKLLQAELSKSEDITSVENINKTPNRDSIGVQMLEEINKNLSLFSERETEERQPKTRVATPRRKKRQTCADVQNLLQRTFHREAGTILKSNTTLSTTRAFNETSGHAKQTLASNEESSDDIFNPFE